MIAVLVILGYLFLLFIKLVVTRVKSKALTVYLLALMGTFCSCFGRVEHLSLSVRSLKFVSYLMTVHSLCIGLVGL